MNSKRIKIYIPSFVLGVMFSLVLLALAGGISYLMNNKDTLGLEPRTEAKFELIKPVNAGEIYPEFVCPCCGKPLDPSNICCGAMKQRIDYIDKQVGLGLSEDKIFNNAVKEFGMDSLVNESKKTAFKEKLLAEAPADSPRIIFKNNSTDMGTVKQSEGVVFAELPFTNEGNSDLLIDKMSSSCGCTSVSIVYRGEEGPTFTMPGHGKENPTNWSVSIAPGDEAILKVYFDPNAHGPQKEPVMQITRTASIYSNDPVEFEYRVRIDLEQIP